MTRRRRSAVVLSVIPLVAGAALWTALPATAVVGWTKPNQVFTSEVNSIVPDAGHRRLALDVGSDAAGTATAVWLQQVSGSCHAEWATRPPGGASWGSPHPFAGPPGTCPVTTGGIVLAVNAAGAAIATWVDGAEVWAAVRPAGAGFRTAVKLSSGLTNSPTASINKDGTIAVGWVMQSGGFSDPSPFQARVRPAGGSFGSVETVAVPGASSVFNPRIAVGPGGDVIAAWARTVPVDLTTSDDVIEMAYRPANGTFPSAPSQTLDGPVTHRTGALTDAAPDLAYDATGRATATWIHDTGSLLEVRSAVKIAAATTFGSPKTVDPGATGNSRAPRLAVDAASGNAVIAWLQCATTCVVDSAARPNGGNFGAVKTLSGALPDNSSTMAPVPGYRSTGDAVVAWSGPVGGTGPDRVSAVLLAGGAFGPAKVISGPAGPADDRGPALAFDAHGNGIAVWAHVTATPSAVLNYAALLASYFRPDAMIKKSTAATYAGAQVFNTSALHQSAQANVKRGSSVTFDVRVVNRSSAVDSVRIKAPGSKSGYAVRYLSGTSGTNAVTSAVVAGTYTLANIPPGAGKTFRLVVKVNSGTAVGASANWLMFATSTHDSTRKDTVNAIVNVVA